VGNGPLRNYSPWRRLWEDAQRALTPTPWPARIGLVFRHSSAIAVETYDVEVAALPKGTALRIAFASDFHAGPTTSPALLDAAVDTLTAAQADLLLLGGDFVSLRPSYAPRLLARLAAVPAPLGRYAVLGNHDYWADAPAIILMLERAGIEMLTNRGVRLPPPFDAVVVSGLDDHTSGEPDAAAAFAEDGPVRVVLMHAPSGLLDIGDRRFDVALCGHTHGGQVALPDGRPLLVAHGRLSRRFSSGRYDLDGGGTLLVSRGVGCTTLPVRLNAPAAITICAIRPPT
jgi:predicted MPP superfamily phosphohydrolase